MDADQQGGPLPVRSYEEIDAPALAGYGFTDAERAARILRSLSGEGVPDALFERLLPALLAALAAAADPDRAVNNFERWAARVGSRVSQFDYLAAHPPALQALIAVFAGSQYFANVLIGQPEYAEVVTNPRLTAQAKTFAGFFRDAGRAVDVFKGPGGKRSALRRFKALEMLRIGTRDLIGAGDTATITREISDFADAVVQKACEFCAQEERAKRGVDRAAPFAVIGMGKLGARELNYASDIDLIFVHGDVPDVPADYYQGLAERLVSALSQATPEGFVFRVDMRLRPEGRFGPLSRSLESCRAYYETWGETWERQALLKARPVAGDPALGAAFIRMAQPFVFGRGGGADVTAALRENKRRIETRMQVAGTWRTSVKEGYGGIRDIEFPVQMFQITLGGAHPSLRAAASTRAALRALRDLGIVTETERRTLEASYWTLRAIEHRLQILDELPVRDLPDDPAERGRLARRLGFADAAAFDARYAEVTETARAFCLRVLGGEEQASDPAEHDWMPLLGSADDPAVRARLRERLAERGFADPERAVGLLLIPAVGTQHGAATPGTRQRFADIVGGLITLCARTADPDAALSGMEALAQASPSREALYAAFAEGGENLMARLCLLAAGSPPLLQSLAQHLELLDMLFDEDEMRTPASREELVARVRERLASTKTEAARIRALGGFWRRERLRVGVRDLWGETTDVAVTGRELTDLAEAMLEGLLLAAAGRAGAQETLPRLAVIGLGKFGGRELNFASDGDLLYVHERAEDAAGAVAIAEVLREIMNTLRTTQNVDMEFDPRLRPDGRFGLLSRTPHEYAAYYRNEAATWEKQTLLKARPVAGNRQIARLYMRIAHTIVYAVPISAAQEAEVRAMKRRIETERVRPADRRTDLKLGRGALSDIEWTTQLLQWRHGAAQEAIRVPGTRDGLEALCAAGLLVRDDFLTLAEGCDFLARLRDVGYLRTGLPADLLPVGQPDRLRAVARRMGFADDGAGTAAEHLRAEHAARTEAVRAVFRRLFLGETP